MESIVSVGIDVGTTTTQVVFSRLYMENTAGIYNVPKVSIVDKEILYRSEPFFTPLLDRDHIDAEKVKGIVKGEYQKAGMHPSDIATGAVIITGESARKENAEAIVRNLSGMAGEFVVSAAGPDMESVIAGKGSGAFLASKNQFKRIVNLDIGGGTTNAVLFNRGRVMVTGCLDVGGRLVRTDENGTVVGFSEAARLVAEEIRVPLEKGSRDTESLKRIAERMSDLLAEMVCLKERSMLYDRLKTPGSSDFEISAAPDMVCYSGGVADAIRGKYDGQNPFQFGDMGILLGEAIRSNRYFCETEILEASNTISATVIGAGSYTTTVSGSTIQAEGNLLPMKNLIVYRMTEAEQNSLAHGEEGTFATNLKRFLDSNGRNFAVALTGYADPAYPDVKRLAIGIVKAADRCMKAGEPLVIVFEHDMAKVFGMCFRNVSARPLISIDGIPVQSADHIDVGRPIVGGLIVPVVVKTLLFGK